MYALEIINALNDLDNSAKPKGLNVKLSKGVAVQRQNTHCTYELELANERAQAVLAQREEHNISHYSSGRFRY